MTHDKANLSIPPNNTPYLVAVAFMGLLIVIAILLITFLRPDKDNTGLIATVISALVPTTAAILALMKAQETHLSVNSRLDAFMTTASAAARAEGKAEGLVEGIAMPQSPPNEQVRHHLAVNDAPVSTILPDASISIKVDSPPRKP